MELLDKHKIKVPWALLASHLASECSKAEEQRLGSWIEADISNRQRYEQAKEIWKTSGQPPLEEHFDMRSDCLATKARALSKSFEEASIIDATSRFSFSMPSWQSVAAVIVMLAAIAASFYWGFPPSTVVPASTPLVVSNINFEEVQQFSLSDGSKITLNRSAKLTYPQTFTQKARVVELSGEAYFDIARDEAHPFIIQTKQSSIKVLGTSFNVRSLAKDTYIEVQVTSGSVLLTSSEKEITLEEGEKGIVDLKTSELSKQKGDRNYLSWMTDELIFEDDKLIDVVKAINRHYQINLSLDQEKANQKYTGTFANEKIEHVLSQLTLTLGLELVQNEDGYRLK